jgi:hypothetical protein
MFDTLLAIQMQRFRFGRHRAYARVFLALIRRAVRRFGAEEESANTRYVFHDMPSSHPHPKRESIYWVMGWMID